MIEKYLQEEGQYGTSTWTRCFASSDSVSQGGDSKSKSEYKTARNTAYTGQQK